MFHFLCDKPAILLGVQPATQSPRPAADFHVRRFAPSQITSAWPRPSHSGLFVAKGTWMDVRRRSKEKGRREEEGRQEEEEKVARQTLNAAVVTRSRSAPSFSRVWSPIALMFPVFCKLIFLFGSPFP